MQQLGLLPQEPTRHVVPFRQQLLKWIGNKQRFAHEIASYFPADFNTYFEPFLGSGAVLGTLAPEAAVGSDAFGPLIELWETVKSDPDQVKRWYADRWERMAAGDKVAVYEEIKADFNTNPNPADLLFISRSCYGGVMRFRQADGYISTPCGAHNPVTPASFAARVDEWHRRVEGTEFLTLDFEVAMGKTQPGDVVYCDPPYSHSQSILYGGQAFSLERLLESIRDCKERGVYVALSIDGSKKSGDYLCDLPIPDGLFEREILVNCGRSMLKRFQMNGQSLESEVVADRLLLTF